MRRVALVTIAALWALFFGPAARAEHVPTNLEPSTSLPADSPVKSSGDIKWLANVQAGHGVAAPLGEGGAFTRDGRRYLVASSTHYGLSVLDVTEVKKPRQIGTYASAVGCAGSGEYAARTIAKGDRPDPVDIALGLTGWENDSSVTPDGRIAILGADAPGRCHDPEYGGLEIIDLSDLSHPRPLALTRNVGYSHSVTIDPAHPWLAYVSSSDGNDFIDIVNFKSCLGGVANLDACEPKVARASFDPKWMPGLPKKNGTDVANYGCHDIRFLRNRAYCAAVTTTSILDTSGVTSTNGSLTGTQLDCPVVDAQRAPGVKVTDCSAWSNEVFAQRGARPADLRLVSIIPHDDSKPADEDIQISHQAEPIDDGKILAITDERGGGLNAGPSACPGGGVWFYDIRDERDPTLMRTPDGDPAVFITDQFVQTGFSCTVHYGQQFGDRNILTFAWYTAGTHVISFDVNYSSTPARVSFKELAAYIPLAGWTIQAKPMGLDPDDPNRLIVYTADESRGVDVFSVAIPRASTSGGSGGGGDTEVRGARTLPRTGSADPGVVGSALLWLAFGVARCARRARG